MRQKVFSQCRSIGLYQYGLLITRHSKYTTYRLNKNSNIQQVVLHSYDTLARLFFTRTVLQQSQQPEWAVCKYTVNQSQHSHPQRTTLATPPVTSPFL
jgi:hypothetical protein